MSTEPTNRVFRTEERCAEEKRGLAEHIERLIRQAKAKQEIAMADYRTAVDEERAVRKLMDEYLGMVGRQSVYSADYATAQMPQERR